MAEKSDGNSDSNGEIFTVNDFVECFDLPRWVEVVGGKDLGQNGRGSCNIQKGMILLFRTLAVENITLSFNDSDTGVKRLVQVSPDTKVKFKVLLPFPDFKNPHMPRTIFETVADLLKVCPTYFKANVCYDDPYMPALVKSGEVFRFIRQIRNVSDRRVYLQCEDADGNVVELPEECKGDFTALEDEKSYTLKEILDLGAVDRKLKLSHDHMTLELVGEEGNDEIFYSNLTHSDGKDVLHRIMGLPLNYNGLVSFHKPKMFLAASPSDRQQEVWKIPLTIDIQVKEFKEEDYERPKTATSVADRDSSANLPVFKMYKLSEMLDTYHEELPILATLVHYKDMPEDFIHSLEPGCDIIIHDIERFDRILAKSGETYFSISRRMPGRFRRMLKKFSSIAEVKAAFPNNLSEDLYLKVMEEMAGDFPVPFSLQNGDVLRFKSLDTKTHKQKSKSKTVGKFPVVHCEIEKEYGSFEKTHLPEDLEIKLHEMPSRTKATGFSAEEIFRFKPEFPYSVEFLPDSATNIWSCLPCYCEIILTNFVTEAFAVVSPVPKTDETEGPQTIDNRVRDCLLVPSRHHVMLNVKDCLGFPPGYFKFPDKSLHIHCPVETISKQTYDDLIRHNDMAYEDYTDESPLRLKSDIELPSKAKQSTEHNYAEAINKRLSKSLNTMFKNRPSIFNKLKFRGKSTEEVPEKSGELAVENETYNPGSIQSDDTYDDENIYDHVDVSKKHSPKK